jgi:hypothetical protein
MHVGSAMILITTLPPMILDEKVRFAYLTIKEKNPKHCT